MKEEKKEFNSITFGVIYFLMFAFAFSLNKDGKMILYPEVGPQFLQTMIVDSAIGIVIGLIVVAFSQYITSKSKALQDLSDEFYKIIGHFRLQEIFFLAFFSSVGEEFLFRGIIQGQFGLLVASIFFGILHTAPGKKGRAWSLFALIMGFVLGAEYMWRKNIFTPIWTHFVVNFLNVYLLQKSRQK